MRRSGSGLAEQPGLELVSTGRVPMRSSASGVEARRKRSPATPLTLSTSRQASTRDRQPPIAPQCAPGIEGHGNSWTIEPPGDRQACGRLCPRTRGPAAMETPSRAQLTSRHPRHVRRPAAAARLPAHRRRLPALPPHAAEPRRCGTAPSGSSTTCCSRCCCSAPSCASPLQPGAAAAPGRQRAGAWWPAASCWPMRCGRWPGVDARLHASGAQMAFRFNSYVALALAERLAGTPGRGLDGGADRACACRCATSPRCGRWRATAARAYLRELAAQPADPQHRGRAAANLLGLQLPDAGRHHAAAHRRGGAAARA